MLYVNVCQRSTAFRPMITAAANEAVAVVIVRFTSSPMRLAVAGEHHQRHQGERDAERQDDLREHQSGSRVDTQREHHQSRGQGQGAAGEERDPTLDEALHHHLTGVGPHARRREPRGEEREREQRRRRGVQRPGQAGVVVFSLARRYAPSQQIYAAYGRLGVGEDHDAFLRLFWTDARRDRFFAVIGFIVDRGRVRNTLIPELHRRRLGKILKVRGEDLPFEMRVSDEHGATIWGPPAPQPLGARVALPMVFYPPEALGPRLVQGIEPVNWTIEVSRLMPINCSTWRRMAIGCRRSRSC